MLVPPRGLGIFAGTTNSEQELDMVVSMADDQLRNHWDPNVQTATMSVFKSSLGQSVHPTQGSCQTILHWALKLNDDKLYQQVGNRCLPWVDTQETILSMVGRQFQGRSADDSGVDWKIW